MRPVMGSEYDVPYVHGLIDEIERLRGIEEQLEALRASVEIVQSERDEAVGKLRSLGLAVVDAMCDQSSTCRATEHKPWCFGYQPAYGIGGNLPGAESTPASIREEIKAIEGPLSPDELEETVTRALDTFGGPKPASSPKEGE